MAGKQHFQLSTKAGKKILGKLTIFHLSFTILSPGTRKSADIWPGQLS